VCTSIKSKQAFIEHPEENTVYAIEQHYLYNKKLGYREENSASVILSWCSLSHFSWENLLDG